MATARKLKGARVDEEEDEKRILSDPNRPVNGEWEESRTRLKEKERALVRGSSQIEREDRHKPGQHRTAPSSTSSTQTTSGQWQGLGEQRTGRGERKCLEWMSTEALERFSKVSTAQLDVHTSHCRQLWMATGGSVARLLRFG